MLIGFMIISRFQTLLELTILKNQRSFHDVGMQIRSLTSEALVKARIDGTQHGLNEWNGLNASMVSVRKVSKFQG